MRARRVAAGLLFAGSIVATAYAGPTSPKSARPAKPAPPPRPPAAPLPMLPSVARVHVRVGRAQVVVTEEVLLPRGEWQKGALDLWVAFGAPSVPRALDAHLVTLGDGVLAPEDDDAGEVVPLERAPRRPGWAAPLLGRDTMAGVVAHLDGALLARAFAPGGMAALRLRSVLEVPEEDPSGGRALLVRLGASRGTPLTLGRVAISVAADAPKLARVGARLCGSDADDHPLAITTSPRVHAGDALVAPVLAVRHASDDLCVRWWSSP